MSYGVVKTYQSTMTSGLTLTSAFDLSSRAWSSIYFDIPSMASGTDFYIQGAAALTGTYRRVKHPFINAPYVETNTFVIGSLCTNRLVLIPTGLRYLKIEQSTAMTDTASTFNLICSD